MWLPPAALTVLAADQAGNNLGPLSLIASSGVAGAFAVAFAMGKIRSKAELDDTRADHAVELKALRDDRDQERAARLELQRAFLTEFVPALTLATDAVKRLAGDG